MKKQWNVTINGVSHSIEYRAGWGSKLLVDGQAHKVKSQNWVIVMIDCPITIDGSEIRLVVRGSKADIAVNGVYQSNGEQYIPLKNVAAWANVLLGISVIGGWLLCNTVGILLGVLFGYGAVCSFELLNLKQGNTGVQSAQIPIIKLLQPLQRFQLLIHIQLLDGFRPLLKNASGKFLKLAYMKNIVQIQRRLCLSRRKGVLLNPGQKLAADGIFCRHNRPKGFRRKSVEPYREAVKQQRLHILDPLLLQQCGYQKASPLLHPVSQLFLAALPRKIREMSRLFLGQL